MSQSDPPHRRTAPRISPSWEPIKDMCGQIQPSHIIGIDEVGRGAWAGPVVAAAVVLQPHLAIDGLADSKLLTSRRRRELDRHIRSLASSIGIGWVGSDEVDEHGLGWAVRESGLRALQSCLSKLTPSQYEVVLDGSHDYLADTTHPSRTIVKADALITPVAAASVVAKVARDRYMATLARRYPDHAFDHHVGYGTRAHQHAIDTHGLTPHHRLSYAPIKRLLQPTSLPGVIS